MARIRNSAAAAKARRSRPATARTMARRARRVEAENSALTPRDRRKRSAPESIGQARVWQRKCHRYELAGLCDVCASAAAWGHAEGFQLLERSGRIPCNKCQPLVSRFPQQAFRGSKWYKILDKLEYMKTDQLAEWLRAHAPKEAA